MAGMDLIKIRLHDAQSIYKRGVLMKIKRKNGNSKKIAFKSCESKRKKKEKGKRKRKRKRY
jgi:hypothetical protein